MSKRTKNIIGFFFLSAFLLFRVANAHAFTHVSDEGDLTHCELCELIQQSNDTDDFSIAPSIEAPAPIIIQVLADDLNSAYEAPVYRFIVPELYLNRPPPKN